MIFRSVSMLDPDGSSIDVLALVALLVMAVYIVTGTWIAIGWHRFVLVGEEADLIPKLRMDRILGYFGIGFLIALIMIILTVIFTFVAGAVFRALLSGVELTPEIALSPRFQLGRNVILVLVYIPITAVGFRLSTILPGVALEPGKGAFDGLIATQDQNGAYFGLATVCAIAYVLGSIPLVFFLPIGGVFSSLYQVVFQWVIMMVGLSILTTLYGHFIEKRPLV